MDPQWILAICAAVTLLILWTSTVVGIAVWIMHRFDSMKEEILTDFEKKHKENSQEVAALRTLVMRHDIILEPEFNGSGQRAKR